MSNEELDELAKQAAYRVQQVFDSFKNEPKEVQQHAKQIIMQRVQRILSGEGQYVLEGRELVTEVPEDK